MTQKEAASTYFQMERAVAVTEFAALETAQEGYAKQQQDHVTGTTAETQVDAQQTNTAQQPEEAALPN